MEMLFMTQWIKDFTIKHKLQLMHGDRNKFVCVWMYDWLRFLIFREIAANRQASFLWLKHEWKM